MVPALLAVADISINQSLLVILLLVLILILVTGALTIQTIHQLTAGESPDGSTLATHLLIFYGFTLSVNVLSTCK